MNMKFMVENYNKRNRTKQFINMEKDIISEELVKKEQRIQTKL